MSPIHRVSHAPTNQVYNIERNKNMRKLTCLILALILMMIPFEINAEHIHIDESIIQNTLLSGEIIEIDSVIRTCPNCHTKTMTVWCGGYHVDTDVDGNCLLTSQHGSDCRVTNRQRYNTYRRCSTCGLNEPWDLHYEYCYHTAIETLFHVCNYGPL